MDSAAGQAYFGHEGYAGNVMLTWDLPPFSTFPNHLLLLLVL
jgi:hypothetical protein